MNMCRYSSCGGLVELDSGTGLKSSILQESAVLGFLAKNLCNNSDCRPWRCTFWHRNSHLSFHISLEIHFQKIHQFRKRTGPRMVHKSEMNKSLTIAARASSEKPSFLL